MLGYTLCFPTYPPLTMKYLFFYLTIIFFSLTFTGCNYSPTEDLTATMSSEKTSVNQDEKMRSISHSMGVTQVVENPQRVIILTNEGTDILLALGVKPIGAVKSWQGDPFYDYIENKMTDVMVIGDEFKPNLELIVSLKPDLIIGSKVRQEQLYPQLSAIAPTVFSETIGVTWKDNLKLYAQAVNKEAEAEKLLQEWEQKVATFKEKLGDNPPTVSLVRFIAGNTRLYYEQSFPGQIVAELGLKRPPAQQKNDFADEIAIENIPLLDADYLFYFTDSSQGEKGKASEEKWLNHPLWQNLEVVKNGQIYQVSDAHWTSSSGILAAHKILDDLDNFIFKKME